MPGLIINGTDELSVSYSSAAIVAKRVPWTNPVRRRTNGGRHGPMPRARVTQDPSRRTASPKILAPPSTWALRHKRTLRPAADGVWRAVSNFPGAVLASTHTVAGRHVFLGSLRCCIGTAPLRRTLPKILLVSSGITKVATKRLSGANTCLKKRTLNAVSGQMLTLSAALPQERDRSGVV
jgi:hypothetical protein